MDWEGEEMMLEHEALIRELNELVEAERANPTTFFSLPPYVLWKPIKGADDTIVAFESRPCYRKGSHKHEVCEERYAREHPKKPQVN
jgi:hypothetical protein